VSELHQVNLDLLPDLEQLVVTRRLVLSHETFEISDLLLCLIFRLGQGLKILFEVGKHRLHAV
jgi:hypothetical protein